jgi:putative transposase
MEMRTAHPARQPFDHHDVEARLRRIACQDCAKWRDKCEVVATSLEEAGDQLFTFTGLPVEQWKSARTTNAIERLHLEFKRRIKTQTVLPSAETAAMLFWALLASDQVVLRKVDGWMSIAQPIAGPFDLAA